jgi:hypothetical protein
MTQHRKSTLLKPLLHLICALLLCPFRKETRGTLALAFNNLFTSATKEQRLAMRAAKRAAEYGFQPRRIYVGKDEKELPIYRIAEPGEKGGSLYGVRNTTVETLGEFGLGTGGYFVYIYGVAIMFLFMAMMLVPVMMFFESKWYHGGHEHTYIFHKGSALCTWTVPMEVFDPLSGLNITHDITRCEVNKKLGLYYILAGMIFSFFTVTLRWKLAESIGTMDDNSQTAKDYAIEVTNPQPSTKDPEEWRKFFAQFGEVAGITVILANGELLECLARRRYIMMMLQYEAPEGSDYLQKLDVLKKDNLQAKVSTRTNRAPGSVKKGRATLGDAQRLQKSKEASMVLGTSWLKSELNRINASKVLNYMGFGLSADEWVEEARLNLDALGPCYDEIYPVARIICVFETMQAQQSCLVQLMSGSIAVRYNWETGIPGTSKFRGVQTLHVQQAEEPSDYCYANFQKV